MNRHLKICLKITSALLTGLTVCAVCGGCSENPNQDKPHPTAVIRVRDYGDIELELYQDVAPNTVANFISLAKDGFYNGHYVSSDRSRLCASGRRSPGKRIWRTGVFH